MPVHQCHNLELLTGGLLICALRTRDCLNLARKHAKGLRMIGLKERRGSLSLTLTVVRR